MRKQHRPRQLQMPIGTRLAALRPAGGRELLRRYRRAFVALIALVLAGAAFYGARWPLRVRDGWEITQKISVSRPDSLALGADGKLQYVTLDTIPGLLVELTPKGPKTVFGDFGSPDGLLLLPDTVMISEDEPQGRVMAYNRSTAKLRIVARLDHPEGMLQRPDGSLIVAQGLPAGRVMALSADAEPKVLIEDLGQPEGLCNLPDGRLGIAEGGRGRILAYGPAGLEVLADDLDGIDQLACGADGSLWAVISRVRSGKLIHIQNGRRRTIARHLRQPQGIALAPDGGVYIAETRANRVLRLNPR